MFAHPARGGAALLLAVALLIPATLVAQEPAAAEAEAAAAEASSPEEQAVRALLRDLVAAFNAKDLDALGALITDEILLVDADGVSTAGREAVLAQYADAFAEAPEAVIEGVLESFQAITPDVARGEGAFTLDAAPGVMDPSAGRYAILAVRAGDAWRLAELRDYPAPAEEVASNEEHLREFAWMIGDWVDESDNARIRSTIRWGLNNNYILRDYSIEIAGEQAMTGVMILGYDPQVGQVKSWVFDSEGGQGEAYWVRVNDTQWVLRARGHLRDGSPTSATQVITLLSDDVVRQNSLDRMIGGELAPDITEVIMVRQPPAPAEPNDPETTDAEPAAETDNGASTPPAP